MNKTYTHKAIRKAILEHVTSYYEDFLADMEDDEPRFKANAVWLSFFEQWSLLVDLTGYEEDEVGTIHKIWTMIDHLNEISKEEKKQAR